MKPESLRIGNYAQDQNGNILVVDELKRAGATFKVVDRSKYPLPKGWQAAPIPINEENLERLGFKNEYGHNFFYRKMKIDWSTGGAWRFHWSQKVTYLDHVHQLQNLAYALFGEELTLKEE